MEISWGKTKEKLYKNVATIIGILKDKDDRFLDELVGGNDYTFKWMMEEVLNHDLYHTAQIVTSYKILASMKRS